MKWHDNPAPLWRVRLIKSIGGFVIAVVVGTLGFLAVPAQDLTRAVPFIVTTAAGLIYGAVYLWLARSTPRDETIALVPVPAPLQERADYLRRMLPLSLLAGVGLSVYTLTQLNAIESGSSRREMVWAPIALAYNTLGYWPAASLLPALAVIIAVSGLRTIWLAKRGQSGAGKDRR